MPDEGQRQQIAREWFLAAFFGSNANTTPDTSITKRLAQIMTNVTVRKGDSLYRRGDLSEDIWFVVKGKISIEREEGAKFEMTDRTLMGAFDVLTNRPRLGDAIAVTDTELLRVRSDDWLDMLEDNFEMTQRAVLGLSRAVTQISLSIPIDGGYPAPQAREARSLPPEPLNFVDRLLVFTDAKILRRAGIQTLTSLVEVTEEKRLEAGEPLFEKGAARSRFYLLAEGEVEATRSSPELRARFGPGGFVCGAATFGGGLASWEARATMPTLALSFPEEDYFDVMEEHFDLALSVFTTLSEERERLFERRPRELPVTP